MYIYKVLLKTIFTGMLLIGNLFPINDKFEIGSKAPEFEATIYGNDENLSIQDFEGDYLLIDIWATYCIICINARPELENFWSKYSDKNFSIWSIATGNTIDEVEKFRSEEYEMPWYHTIIENPMDSYFMRFENTQGLPQYILISPQGEVLKITRDFSELSLGDLFL